MSSKNKNLRLVGAFAALGALALAVSCKGFFVNPTLSTIAVGPASPTIETGNTNNTVQMTVFGTNSDGSTTSNPSVTWTIASSGTGSGTDVATISKTGLVTSVATGTATVTATSNQNPSITGTQGLTVTLGCINQIILKPSSGGSLTPQNPSETFQALANTCTQSGVDITSVATWTSSNTSIATVSAGVVTAAQTTGSNGTITITASSGGITSNPITITVTGF